MNDGLTVGLSAQIALEKRLTTISSNIANTRTVGFRAAEVKFEDVVARQQAAEGNTVIAFASDGAEFANTEAGGIEKTGSPFDFAINGDAWFALETPAGIAVTRDGRFKVTGEGAVVSLGGHPVLDPGGAPLEVNPGGGTLEVGADGFIRQDGAQVGALGLYAFQPGPDFSGEVDAFPLASLGNPLGTAGQYEAISIAQLDFFQFSGKGDPLANDFQDADALGGLESYFVEGFADQPRSGLNKSFGNILPALLRAEDLG